MVRMGGSYSINVQSMVGILRKALPERKDVDRHMVYNVRLRACQRKLELEDKNVEVLAHHLIHPLLRIINLVLIIILKVSCY